MPWFLPLALALACLLSSAPRAWTQHTVQWTTNYYSVTGATLPELRFSLRQSRPWRDRSPHDAQTDWRVNWRFELRSDGSDWRCESFTTRLTIAVTMPRWLPPTNATEAVRETWGRYYVALARHEIGHAQIGLAAADTMQKAVPLQNGEPSRAALTAKLNRLCENIVAGHRRRDEEYDRRTEHGATDGAVLPGRSRSRP